MTQSVNESIRNKAVYRTAPATPGLLITVFFVGKPRLHQVCQECACNLYTFYRFFYIYFWFQMGYILPFEFHCHTNIKSKVN